MKEKKTKRKYEYKKKKNTIEPVRSYHKDIVKYDFIIGVVLACLVGIAILISLLVIFEQ